MITSNQIRIFVLASLVVVIVIAATYLAQHDELTLQLWLENIGATNPLGFMLIYAVAAVLFVPGSLLTITGGVIYGPAWGTIINLTGATLGATIAFLISRYLASDWVAKRTRGRLKQLIRGVEEEGWKFVALTRLVPLFPFNALNYALGLTRIRIVPYIITSYICMLPGAVAYTYLGHAGREAVAGGEDFIYKVLLAIGFVALVVFLPQLIKRVRHETFSFLNVSELKEQLDKNEDVVVLDVRDVDEYEGKLGHISGSLNIAVDALSTRLSDLDEYFDKPIIIVCRTDCRSKKAAALLKQFGYRNVSILQGGMEKWNFAGMPVER